MAADVVREQVVREQHAAGRAGDLHRIAELHRRVRSRIHQVGPGQGVGAAAGQPLPEPQVRPRPDPQVALVVLAVVGQPDAAQQREGARPAIGQRGREAVHVRTARAVRPRRDRGGQLREVGLGDSQVRAQQARGKAGDAGFPVERQQRVAARREGGPAEIRPGVAGGRRLRGEHCRRDIPAVADNSLVQNGRQQHIPMGAESSHPGRVNYPHSATPPADSRTRNRICLPRRRAVTTGSPRAVMESSWSAGRPVAWSVGPPAGRDTARDSGTELRKGQECHGSPWSASYAAVRRQVVMAASTAGSGALVSGGGGGGCRYWRSWWLLSPLSAGRWAMR